MALVYFVFNNTKSPAFEAGLLVRMSEIYEIAEAVVLKDADALVPT